MNKVGHFWALGVGPGDPELLTLKAVRLLQLAHVIYHAGPRADQGRALEIVRRLLRPEQEVRTVRTASMGELSADDEKSLYRPAVEQMAADCRQGRDVVFVTEGDPTLYSTAAVVWQLLTELAPDVPIEVIPGVTSLTAAAARARWPLAQKDELLLVAPAGYHAGQVEEWLKTAPNLAMFKVPPALPEIVESVAQTNSEAIYLENVSTPQEWLTRNLAEAKGRSEYFSLALLRQTKTSRARSASKALSLQIVGLGPGDPKLLTRQALAALQSADAIVGYEGYLQSLSPLGLRAELHGSPIGAEKERAEHALQLARAGRKVALVSSGDAGVYGMASLLLETAEKAPEIEIEVVPGVTAALSAAALLGAPLGHDFVCLSLSDLLTPWEVIEKRLHAAGQADFVLALYNPVSRERDWQLPRARDILLQYRAPQTPVGLVDKAYRPGQRVWHTTLGDLTMDGIGMETTVIVGGSQTRVMQGRLVTPRGYARLAAPRREARTSRSPAGSRLNERIVQESFTIIERELGPHVLPPWAFAVARRMIHASADFDFARTLRFSPDFETAFREAIRSSAPILTDTEMVRVGLRAMIAESPGVSLACHLNDAETVSLAKAEGLTRSAAGIRVAARKRAAPIVVIGNAPTALDEALRLVEQEGWRPAVIVGMPVGFVGVEEAKSRLLAQVKVPYLTCIGRKGGSAVAAAAVNALLELSRNG